MIHRTGLQNRKLLYGIVGHPVVVCQLHTRSIQKESSNMLFWFIRGSRKGGSAVSAFRVLNQPFDFLYAAKCHALFQQGPVVRWD